MQGKEGWGSAHVDGRGRRGLFMKVADCSMILHMFFANILVWIVEVFPNTVPKCKS